jgi:alkylation response protein AidB-like acyl-CoA dehydrogenase
MITEPLTNADHLEIRDIVVDVAAATFTSEHVRAAAAAPLGYDSVAWKNLVELGWPGLGVSAEAGGEELGAVVQCIVHRELGARLAPTPFLASAAFASAALAKLGSPELAGPLLTAIVDDTTQCALVLGHGRGWPGSGAGVVATENGGEWALSGAASLVLDAARASVLLVVAADEHGAWHLFHSDGASIEPVATVDITRAFADVRFDRTPAVLLSDRPLTREEVAGQVDTMAVYLAAEMVGAAISCHRQTLDYLGTRHQFGKPIGSFQALKHRAADIAVSVTIAQELVFSAAELIDAGNTSDLSLAAPLTLGRVGEVLKHTAEEAIQLHGGVGFTDEVDIGLYYKRAISDLELIAAPVDAYARMDEVRLAVSA